MSGVRCDRVCKDFGAVRAVDTLDLEIDEGEFVSILGPSGCGKTTLLRMLAGLEQPSEGSIHIGGERVNDLPPSKRDIAMVFQTYALYSHMTVAGNIEYPLKKRRVPKQQRAELVAKAAELLQLDELLARKPRELSGGQQQRVALGRALVRDPAVFLLDEPLSNLDAKLRAHMRAELIQLHRRIGRTMVYVTHDQLEAMTMSNRIAVLRDGRLQQFATPETIYARPANDFVAGFIGTPSMNLLDGELVTAAEGMAFRSGALTLSLAGISLDGDYDAGMAVRVGIRPEDLLLGEAGEEAQVTMVEPTGHEVIVMFDLLGHEVVGRVNPDLRLRVDDAVRISPRADRLHVFAASDGRRINQDPQGER
jgi:multiple sugar transport system ATP-binding protein